MPHSLRYQLLSRSLLILFALLILIGIFQYVFMNQFIYRNKAASIQSQIRTIPYQVWLQLSRSQGMDPNDNPLFTLDRPDSTVAFVDMNGHFYDLFDDPSHGAAPRLSQQDYEEAFNPPKGGVSYHIVQDNQGVKDLVVLEPVGTFVNPIGVVQVSTRVGPLQDVLVQQLTIFIFLAICALIAGLLTFLPILRRTLDPLSRMVDTVGRINAGNLDEEFPTSQAQLEIELLSSSFNDMLDRLKVSFEAEREAKEKMRQFVADASHELRTPLTSIHGFLEVLLRGAATNPNQLQNALKSMYGESERLTKLVQDLLFLARLDREPTFVLTEGRLDVVVHDMEPQLRLLAGDRDVVFSVTEPVRANMDSDRMKQVILNLFQNAVQHTDSKDGRIQVSLTHHSNGITLTVQDNGIGIPEEYQAQLFERFYRIDSARSRKHGGAGLGLAITQSIVERHGGTITCHSKFAHGALFRVWLPTTLPNHE